jgi:hypothetical protein
VLVEGDHGIRLTLAEYNGRAFDERLPAGVDTAEARARYLGSLIDYKVAAVEARLRGYLAKDMSSLVAQERDLAQQLLQQSILEASNISDHEALAFVREHPDLFPGVDPTHGAAGLDMMHIKYKLQDQRLRTQLEDWAKRENVIVHADRLRALGTPSSQENQP